MKLKIDEHGNAVLDNGMPVYVHADGKESPFDAAGTVAVIARLNAEAKTHRLAKEAAETKLATYSAIEDPAAALKALETIQSLDQKKLMDVGKVEELKKQINDAWEVKLKVKDDEVSKLNGQLFSEKIGGSFSRSEYVSKRLAIPVDIVEAKFGRHFRLEEGQVRAYDSNGNPVYSKSNPGNPASFDEALEVLVDSYPNRESILKSDQKPGGGANPSDGKAPPRTISRAQFAAKNSTDQRKFLAEQGKVTD